MIAQPAVAIETLENLAKWQSDTDDPERDAEPGKMPHELRVGEWAHFGLVPHRPYYGTADATPLYLLLLAEKQGGLPVSRGLVSPRQVVRGLAVHDLVDEAWRLRVPLVRHSHGVERGLHEPVPDRRGDVIAI